MESLQNSFSHELSRAEQELEPRPLENDWEYDEPTWSSYDGLEVDEEPDEDSLFHPGDASYSDVEQGRDADEELSLDEEYVQDSVEYVHFGKGLEYDGEQWIWEEYVDLWSELSRRFSTICRLI
jgi:hypothetical protein